jgi:hypothetical protein
MGVLLTNDLIHDMYLIMHFYLYYTNVYSTRLLRPNRQISAPEAPESQL